MEPATALSTALFAVADESRRTLLQRLVHGPATTGQLAELLPISRPAVSQHLKLLKDAGLIATVSSGRHSWHQIETEPLERIAEWAARIASAGKIAPALRLSPPPTADSGKPLARPGCPDPDRPDLRRRTDPRLKGHTDEPARHLRGIAER